MRYIIFILVVIIITVFDSGTVYAITTNTTKPVSQLVTTNVSQLKSELQIRKVARAIMSFGFSPNSQYHMQSNGIVCSNFGKCYQLTPVGSAKARAGGIYSDFYGSSIMAKILMEYILGVKIPFNSGERPSSIGSNRHHYNGASYAFDLVVPGVNKKAAVAAAWKYATQSLGFQASVGMRYAHAVNMIHVDTNGFIGARQWGHAQISSIGAKVLGYYGRVKNIYMPYTVLAEAVNNGPIFGQLYTGTLNGSRTYLPTVSGVQWYIDHPDYHQKGVVVGDNTDENKKLFHILFVKSLLSNKKGTNNPQGIKPRPNKRRFEKSN